MNYIIRQEKETEAPAGLHYVVDEAYGKPTQEEFSATISRLNNGFKRFPIEGAYEDEPSIRVVDEPNDTPGYVIGLEMSVDDAICPETISFITNLMKDIPSKFKLLLSYEYNFVGYDFICFFEEKTVTFEFKDEVSQKKFGVS